MAGKCLYKYSLCYEREVAGMVPYLGMTWCWTQRGVWPFNPLNLSPGSWRAVLCITNAVSKHISILSISISLSLSLSLSLSISQSNLLMATGQSSAGEELTSHPRFRAVEITEPPGRLCWETRKVTIWKSVKFYNFNNQICLERMSWICRIVKV